MVRTSPRLRPLPIAVILLTLGFASGEPKAQTAAEPEKAHLDPDFGAFRDASVPRGDCRQCHVAHEDFSPNTENLFTDNNNYLCFSPDGIGGCHATEPVGGTAGYPAQAGDRLPLSTFWQGYFEANNAGLETHGVDEQVRWPGQQIWDDPNVSAHAYDADMPLKDDMGRGACANCHNVHTGVTPFDLLVDSAGPITSGRTTGPPTAYGLCFGCHSTGGPAGMDPESRLIADFYDDRNGDRSTSPGHQFRGSHGAVLSRSKLPCYNCHNPHGSAGGDGLQPNAYLLSDERPGWYGLTDTKNDAAQVRRFCNGCHPFSDGVGGGSVEGVLLPPLPANEDAHRSTSIQHCYDAHGRDYGSPGGRNVHNPDRGVSIPDQ